MPYYIFLYNMANTAKLLISLSPEDKKNITLFVQKEGYNLSAKTVQLWKNFIKNAGSKK